jgi:hypothetical protein
MLINDRSFGRLGSGRAFSIAGTVDGAIDDDRQWRDA